MLRWFVLLATIPACGLEQNLTLDLPDLSGVESMVVAVERSGALYVYAEDVDPDGALTIPIALPPGADARIDILTYDTKLEQQQIEPGQVLPAESDPMRPLPPPSQHFTSNVERGVASAAEPGTRGDALAAFRIAGTGPALPGPCFEWAAEQINLQGEREDVGYQGFEIAVSEERVLVGTPNEELFTVTLEGVTRISVEPAGVAITAGAIDESGGLWFGD